MAQGGEIGVQQLLSDAGSYITNVFGSITIVDVLDVIIVAVLIYQVIRMTRKTRASQVFKGVGIMLVAYAVSYQLKFQVLTWLLNYLVGSGAVVMVVIFQPEIRRALEQIGRRTAIERGDRTTDEGEGVNGIVSAMLVLSRRKVGALIVLEGKTGLSDIVQSGTRIDSLISDGLLINIFEPNTPLHDGAVIIKNLRIVSAGCVLPLTENNMLSQELGTRHRAGLGVTEGTDAVSLIVSEETGTISMARGGRLTRYLDEAALRRILEEIYQPDKDAGQNLFTMLRRRLLDK